VTRNHSGGARSPAACCSNGARGVRADPVPQTFNEIDMIEESERAVDAAHPARCFDSCRSSIWRSRSSPYTPWFKSLGRNALPSGNVRQAPLRPVKAGTPKHGHARSLTRYRRAQFDGEAMDATDPFPLLKTSVSLRATAWGAMSVSSGRWACLLSPLGVTSRSRSGQARCPAFSSAAAIVRTSL
jgi:hypothetical protein